MGAEGGSRDILERWRTPQTHSRTSFDSSRALPLRACHLELHLALSDAFHLRGHGRAEGPGPASESAHLELNLTSEAALPEPVVLVLAALEPGLAVPAVLKPAVPWG